MNTSKIRNDAIHVFKVILNSALNYRGEHCDSALVSTSFNNEYGICVNIDNMGSTCSTATNALLTVMSNVVEKCPSYSGDPSYPVSAQFTGWADAFDAFNSDNEIWKGQYGLNRVNLLKEIIDYCENNWDDSLTIDVTPAMRAGFVVGSLYKHKEDGSVWEFIRDDMSMNPDFKNVVTGSNRFIRISKLEKLDAQNKYDSFGLTELHTEHKLLSSESNSLKIKIKELQDQLTTICVNKMIVQRKALHDFGVEFKNTLENE